MIVQCVKCSTKFRLDETKIGQRGAKVRCSKCQHSFVVKRPPAPVAAGGFNPDTAPTAPVKLDAATTAPGAGFAVDEPTTDLSPTPGFTADSGLPAIPSAGATDPDIPGLPLPPGPDLPNLPGASDLPELPSATPSRDPIHEVQTAVYMVPDSIRAAALEKQSAGIPAAGLSATDVAAIDLDDDDRTGIVPPEVLAQAKAAAAAEAAPPTIDDIPSAEADLIDDDEVTLVSSESASPKDPAEGLDAMPGDPFASAPAGGGLPPKDPAEGLDAMPGDPFASAPAGGGLPPQDPAAGLDAMPGDPFANAPAGGGLPPVDAFAGADISGESALGRIQPAVLGGGEDGASPLEVAPPSAGLAAALESETTKPPPPGAQLAQPAEEKGGWSLGVKLVTTVVGVAILGIGVLLWLGGGRLDLSVIGLGGKGAKGTTKKLVVGYKDVHPVAIRSVLYPTRAGKQVLVFVGRAENRAGEARKHVAAVAELRNRKGELVASARAPVGLALNPGFVSNLTDSDSLAKAYSSLAVEQGEPTLPSRGVVPFTVVLLQPPKGLADLEHSVRLAKGEPVLKPEPEPEPEPEVVEPEEEIDDRKGKRKRKGKRRRGKRKAKALPADEEE